MPDLRDALRGAGVTTSPNVGSFFDEGGHLRPELVGKEMDRKAKELAEARLSTHQLRRFFNHCREIERRLRSRQSEWAGERANVQRIGALAADAAGKGKLPPAFRAFLDENVARISSQRDFTDGFMPHFEALVGYSALYLKEDRR